MAKSLVLNIPHELGAAGAKQRLVEGLDSLKQKFGDKVNQADIAWTDDHADIAVAAMGQSVTARLDVLPESVRVEVDLPWMLAALAGRVQGYLQGAGEQMLRLGKS